MGHEQNTVYYENYMKYKKETDLTGKLSRLEVKFLIVFLKESNSESNVFDFFKPIYDNIIRKLKTQSLIETQNNSNLSLCHGM